MLKFFNRDFVDQLNLRTLAKSLRGFKGDWTDVESTVRSISSTLEIILRRVATEAKKGGR